VSSTPPPTPPAPLFPIADPDRRAKGRRAMRALQKAIADVWTGTIETDTGLVPGGRLLAEAEMVAIAVGQAATAARTLDRHVFGDEYPRARRADYRSSMYERFRTRDHQGRVVTALAMIRNIEIHVPVLIDPDIDRAVSIPGISPTAFRVFPRWVPYRRLPAEVRGRLRTSRKLDERSQGRAYRSHLAGSLVTETLLDALAFFLRCDPLLARRTPNGELERFPLPPLIQHDPYERRHPEWPAVESVAADARSTVAARPPSGSEREIVHRLIDANGDVEAYVGYTQITPAFRDIFTERPEQIVADIAGGYRYRIAEDDVQVADDGRLAVNGTSLDDVVLAPFPSPGAEGNEDVCRRVYRLTQEDGFYHARQRSTT
jgi:hypothetical protein